MLTDRKHQWSLARLCCSNARTWCRVVTMVTGHAGWRCLEACLILAVSLLATGAICCCSELVADSSTNGPKLVLSVVSDSGVGLCRGFGVSYPYLTEKFGTEIIARQHVKWSFCYYGELGLCEFHVVKCAFLTSDAIRKRLAMVTDFRAEVEIMPFLRMCKENWANTAVNCSLSSKYSTCTNTAKLFDLLVTACSR